MNEVANMADSWISVTVTVTVTQQPCQGSQPDPVRRHLQINGNYLWAISKSQSEQSLN